LKVEGFEESPEEDEFYKRRRSRLAKSYPLKIRL